MKKLILVLAMLIATNAFAVDTGVPNRKDVFTKVIYFEHGSKGSSTGTSPDNAIGLIDNYLWEIPADTVIEKVYVVIDTAVAGSTDLDVGDDDDADGFVDGSSSVTIGTAGLYGYDAGNAGQYLMVDKGVIGGTGNFRSAKPKYYSAAGKTMKATVTGTSSAGKGKIVVEGYRL